MLVDAPAHLNYRVNALHSDLSLQPVKVILAHLDLFGHSVNRLFSNNRPLLRLLFWYFGSAVKLQLDGRSKFVI